MKKYVCKYCGKLYEKIQSLGGHEKWCNPETRPDFSGEKNPMWGKGHLAKNQWSDVNWTEVPFELLGGPKRRTRLLEEANKSCTICGFNETRPDGTIILQIDHIDGDRKNNTKENLRVLCPNCHAVHSTKFMHIGQKHSEETKKKCVNKNAAVSPRFPKPLKG